MSGRGALGFSCLGTCFAIHHKRANWIGAMITPGSLAGWRILVMMIENEVQEGHRRPTRGKRTGPIGRIAATGLVLTVVSICITAIGLEAMLHLYHGKLLVSRALRTVGTRWPLLSTIHWWAGCPV